MQPTRKTSRPQPERGGATRVGLALALLGLALVVGVMSATAHAASGQRARVTVIGDSVTEALDYVPAAKRYLGRGLDLHADAVVCRRLVATSCAFQGTQPSTVLQIVSSEGHSLGSVVVINVGYNDWGAVYDVDRVMRALKVAGVQHVVWVTLREAGSNASIYAQSNARIRSSVKRWRSRLVVADWNAYSRGQSWFVGDGLHLTPAGAFGLAHLLRPLVLAGTRS